MASSKRGRKWTESMSLKLIREVIKVEKDIRRGSIKILRPAKWALICDGLQVRTPGALQFQFLRLLRRYKAKSPHFTLTHRICNKLMEYEQLCLHLEGGPRDNLQLDLTVPNRMRLIENNTLLEGTRRLAAGGCLSLRDKRAISRNKRCEAMGGTAPPVIEEDHASPFGTSRSVSKEDHASTFGTSRSVSEEDHASPFGTFPSVREEDHASPFGTSPSASEEDHASPPTRENNTNTLTQGGDKNQTIDPKVLNELLNIYWKEKSQSFSLIERLFNGLPEGRTIVDKLRETWNTEGKKEATVPKRRKKEPLLSLRATSIYDGDIRERQQRLMRFQIQATYDRLHLQVAEALKQTSNDLLQLIPCLSDSALST